MASRGHSHPARYKLKVQSINIEEELDAVAHFIYTPLPPVVTHGTAETSHADQRDVSKS